MICKDCGNMVADGAKFCNACGATMDMGQTSQQGMDFDFSTNTVSAAPESRYQYKVLSQKDKWFSGKFDPTLLEQAINAYAQQGWRFVGCATADVAGFGVTRQEFVAILERKV